MSWARNDITTLALYGHGSETILFFSMGHGKVIHFPIIIWFYKHFSLRYFATKFDLLMFSNIFDIVSTFTVELKVYFLLFYQYNNNKMAACVNMKYSPKTHFK